MVSAIQHWWVNHDQPGAAHTDGDFICVPKRNAGRNHGKSYKNLARAQPGDVVFGCSSAAVQAIGVVLERAFETDGPNGASDAGPQAVPACYLPIRSLNVETPLLPARHVAALGSALPLEHSPLRATGAINHSVYFAAIPAAMAAILRELLAGQVEGIERKIRATSGTDLDAAIAEHALWQRTDIAIMQRRQLLDARRGQGVFRQNVEKIESACRLTGLLDRRHLRARHIKPWWVADDREKLDGHNGLLLSAHADHLFGRGHISFADDGEVLVSKHLNPAVMTCWRLPLPINVGMFTEQQRRYLDYHRREIFESQPNGRRSSDIDERDSGRDSF